MNANTKIQNLGIIFLFYLIATIVLFPFRNSVSQDDGAYAAQVIELAKGHFALHPDIHGSLLPQFTLGALAIKVLSFLPPLPILNGLTWITFLGVALFLYGWFGFSGPLVISFLSIPFWFQYGASYLYDVYTVFLLTLYLFFISKRPGGVLEILTGILLVLQLQTLIVVPFFFGLFHLLFGEKRRLAAVRLITSFIGLGIYFLIPKNLTQMASIHWLIQFPQNPLNILAAIWQLVFSIGFFLLPIAEYPKYWSAKSILIGIVLFIVTYLFLLFADVHVLAARVFFSDYLPRPLAVVFPSVGIWGWIGIRNLFKKVEKEELIPVICIFIVIFLFLSVRGIADMRYAMTAVPLVLWTLRRNFGQYPCIGNNLLIAGTLMVFSLFLNLYQLNTTQARWIAASSLEKIGVDSRDVTAGYGRDLFKLEWDCVNREYTKLGSPSVSDPTFLREIYSKNPRLYQEDWIPKYVIKPYRFVNKILKLKSNVVRGQELEPVATLPYKCFGLPFAIAVYENPQSQRARCFRDEI